MMQEFIKNGYEIVEFEEVSDVYVVNTCTVTNMADKKSRQMLRKVKEINPNSILVAVGCYAQVAKDELTKISEIDLILGTNEKKEILTYIEEINNTNQVVTDVIHNPEFIDFGSVSYTEKTRAVIKVQDGCDRYCSYCIIPYARGRVRSRRPESVVKEVKEIANKGIKEVVITGIHIASYGKDFKEKDINEFKNNYELCVKKEKQDQKEYRLIELLEDINEINGIERIRLGSIEPTLITEEFVNRLTKLNKICDHFHLSLQSGCDETLKRMNRRYTTEEFEDVTCRLRKAYPNVALTTDIIVGFPNETDEEFNQTYNHLKKIAFYKMHIFKYSQRKGTKAAVMPNQIDGKVKEERSKRLIELSDENEIKYNETYIGKAVKVLLEDEHIENGIRYIKGHTTNYIIVKVKMDNEKQNYGNTIREVQIESMDGTELIGKFV